MYGRRSQFGPVMTDSPILSVLTVVNWHVNSVNQQHRPHQWFFTTGLENVWQPQKCILSWKMFGNLKKCILSWKMFGNLKKMHLILENGWQPQEVHLILSLWCNSKKLYLGQQSFWQSWQKLLSGQKQPVCRISSSNQMTNVIFIHLQKCEIWNVKNLWRVGGNNTESSQKLKRNRGKEGECGSECSTSTTTTSTRLENCAPCANLKRSRQQIQKRLVCKFKPPSWNCLPRNFKLNRTPKLCISTNP